MAGPAKFPPAVGEDVNGRESDERSSITKPKPKAHIPPVVNLYFVLMP